jgi:Xaa-Pro aminopeptidase
MFERILATVLSQVDLVDGEVLLRAVRRTKSPADVVAIRAACDLAVAALDATRRQLHAGVTERALTGAFERRMAELGATTPALEASCCVVDDGAPFRTFPTDRAVRDGDLVHVHAGVLRDGWEGPVRATLVCSGSPVALPRLDELVACCTAGTLVDDLRSRDRSGASGPEIRHEMPTTMLDGVGMGHEVLADDDVLEPGMVVALECVEGGVLGGAVVQVTAGDPDVLLRT